jgi:hypothetical protein
VATSVKITRPDELPFYVNADDLSIKNIAGFTVDLSLIEVSPSYAEALPHYGDFTGSGLKLSL